MKMLLLKKGLKSFAIVAGRIPQLVIILRHLQNIVILLMIRGIILIMAVQIPLLSLPLKIGTPVLSAEQPGKLFNNL